MPPQLHRVTPPWSRNGVTTPSPSSATHWLERGRLRHDRLMAPSRQAGTPSRLRYAVAQPRSSFVTRHRLHSTPPCLCRAAPRRLRRAVTPTRRQRTISTRGPTVLRMSMIRGRSARKRPPAPVWLRRVAAPCLRRAGTPLSDNPRNLPGRRRTTAGSPDNRERLSRALPPRLSRVFPHRLSRTIPPFLSRAMTTGSPGIACSSPTRPPPLRKVPPPCLSRAATG